MVYKVIICQEISLLVDLDRLNVDIMIGCN